MAEPLTDRLGRLAGLARTVIYGRLEDEKPFSTVRWLVEYEDHLLRLMRDAGLPTRTRTGSWRSRRNAST